MDTEKKLKILGQQAKFDACGCPAILDKKWLHPSLSSVYPFVYTAIGEGGRSVRLFKTLQMNACRNNCRYCANRRDRDFFRTWFTPEELARIFMEYYRRRLADGFFLSSAIVKNSEWTQEKILETLKILRERYGYRGYVHTKIMPGISGKLVQEISRYSDRISVNLEGINQKYLSILAPDKNFDILLATLKEISYLNTEKPLKAGVTTQIVVGASGEKDSEILKLSRELYKNLHLWRVYYSRFDPVPDTPLQHQAPCTHLREVRLYQADFLLRKYGFEPDDFVFNENGNLPEGIDPKLAWAMMHPEFFPVEINTAPFEKLLRVPGVGRISATRIVEIRRQTKFLDMEQLKKIGVRTGKARGYITLNGRFYGTGTGRPVANLIQACRPEEKIPFQPFLWEEI